MADGFPEEKVQNLYGWLVFDKCVKGKNRQQLLEKEAFISRLPERSPQKNCREEKAFPCPATIGILKLCEAYAENLFNARKIEELLSKLNPNLLSVTAKPIDTEDRGNIELASDVENYFALKTKALLKLERYQDCKDCCAAALQTLTTFHYNNDLWFKMRIALAEEGLGNHEQSEILLKDLLNCRAGNDKWFLYRDIAEVYYEKQDFDKAWKYSVNAAFHGNEPQFLINLYLLQARILFKLERSAEGKVLAELVAGILKEQGWREKPEHSKLFQFYSVDPTNVDSVQNTIKQAKEFWGKERYKGHAKVQGKIINVHKNGKIGRIKINSNDIIEFQRKALNKRVKNLEELKGAVVEFYIMDSFEGKQAAEGIEVIKVAAPLQETKIGEILEGTVKNVSDFGVFITLKNKGDGLLHINSLPNNLKDNFRELFTKGKVLKVKINRISSKGLQLALVENI
jgi:hypothetical protein